MKVALVTTTFSENPEALRFQLALKTCRAAKATGYPLYIVDGSPETRMIDMLLHAGATMVTPEKTRGMGASRRQCFRMGLESGADVVVWIEPEKHSLVPFIGGCVVPIQKKRAKAVVPRRRNLDGYPQYQQLSEFRGNWEIGNILGRSDLDLFMGPRVMDREATEVMASYDPHCGQNTYGDRWEILFVPIVQMLARGWPIESVLVDYVHPPEQLAEDDTSMRTKRDEQLKDIVSAVTAEAKRLGISCHS